MSLTLEATVGLDLTRPDLLRTGSFFAGRWRDAGETRPVRDPASGLLVSHVSWHGAAGAEEAVAAAHDAMPAWRARTAKQRGDILLRWRDLILAHVEDLARVMTAEQGKPLAEARAEVAYAASFLEWFAAEARRAYGQVISPHLPDKRIVTLREPVGVVAAITPWNFPAAMITRKVGPALAVGCTVVLKPSELTPFSALALAVLAEEAGVPAGVFNVVVGDAAEIGEVLTTDERVRKFSFTGSTAVGKMLAARCMSTVKRVSLELGGNAPFIVFEDANLEAAVEGAMVSKFRNTGQTCVCANRLLVHDKVYDAFAERLTARVAALVVGPGLEAASQQGPLINADARIKVERHVQDAIAKGARLTTGGSAMPGAGYFHQPTVLIDVTRDMAVSREETFGPVAALMRFSSEAEAVALANDTKAGLAAYVFTRDMARSSRVAEALEYGMIGLNTGLISTEVAPFGGVKESGFGREGSSHGVDDYLNIKMICSDAPQKHSEP